MSCMFSCCSALNSLDLSNFNTSSVTTMQSMFYSCKSLTFLDLSHFNISNVKTMETMFSSCFALNFVNLSNFNTSSVTSLQGMFSYCSALKSLDLSSFNTSGVTTMQSMFFSCSGLNSLDLSNFNTSQVATMKDMFNRCSSLTLLNLSNFNTSQVTDMDCIFYRCENLENVDLGNAEINQYISFSNSCSNHPSKLTICSENEDWKILFQLSELQYVKCINNISSISLDGNQYMMKCYKNNIELNNQCQICGNNHFKKSENINGITYINCYEYKEGYYFDDIELNYKSCYSSCKKCNKSGNETEHNCIECKDGYTIENNLSIYKNCLKINMFDESESEIQNRTELIKNMIYNLFNGLNISYINSGKDEKIFGNNISIIITSTKNQKNNENEKMVTINLGECEIILKDIYNISKNDSLYMLQIISEEEEMKIPKIEYEVYCLLYNSNNFNKLNLDFCKDTKIEISIPVKINDNIDKYNPKSSYYN